MPDESTNSDLNADDGSVDNYPETLPVFQDDTVTDDTVIDPIMLEQQREDDDPVSILGVPEQIFKEELDKRAFDGTGKPSVDGTARTSDDVTMYEGTEDAGGDVYNEQEDAFDQASDKLDNQDGEDNSRNA